MQPRPIAETIGPPRPSFRCFILVEIRLSVLSRPRNRQATALQSFPFLSARMAKFKLPRMQHLSWKILCKARRIDFIAEHRMTEMMKMHADLVSPSAV